MTNQRNRLRILVAYSQWLFRESVGAALESQSDIQVVAEACDGVQAVSQARRTNPEVALVEAGLPNGDGFRTTRLIREEVPACVVLILADRPDDRMLLDAAEAGASGYLTQASPLAHLIEAIRVLSTGGTFVPPHMTDTLRAHLVRRRREESEARHKFARLTPRERRVLTLLADGADNDRISQVLVISPHTARTHAQNVLTKLGVHSRLDAAALATLTGIATELEGTERVPLERVRAAVEDRAGRSL